MSDLVIIRSYNYCTMGECQPRPLALPIPISPAHARWPWKYAGTGWLQVLGSIQADRQQRQDCTMSICATLVAVAARKEPVESNLSGYREIDGFCWVGVDTLHTQVGGG